MTSTTTDVARRPTDTDRPDVRAGGAWTRGQRVKNDAIYWTARLALSCARALPARWRRICGSLIGMVCYLAARDARRTAMRNVGRVFPAESAPSRKARVRRSFLVLGATLGEAAGDLGGASSDAAMPALSAGALAILDRARARGRGVVFASAHLGPWERVAASMASAGVPLVAMARESYDPRFTRLFAALRARSGVRTLWRSDRGLAWKIVRALRNGDVLGIPMDLRARVECRWIPLLGHPALTPIGPARIALRTGAPVVVGTAAPGDGGELVVTATDIESDDLADDEAGAIALAGRINAELSRRILALPEAWPWMHDRWGASGEV